MKVWLSFVHNGVIEAAIEAVIEAMRREKIFIRTVQLLWGI